MECVAVQHNEGYNHITTKAIMTYLVHTGDSITYMQSVNGINQKACLQYAEITN